MHGVLHCFLPRAKALMVVELRSLLIGPTSYPSTHRLRDATWGTCSDPSPILDLGNPLCWNNPFAIFQSMRLWKKDMWEMNGNQYKKGLACFGGIGWGVVCTKIDRVWHFRNPANNSPVLPLSSWLKREDLSGSKRQKPEVTLCWVPWMVKAELFGHYYNNPWPLWPPNLPPLGSFGTVITLKWFADAHLGVSNLISMSPMTQCYGRPQPDHICLHICISLKIEMVWWWGGVMQHNCCKLILLWPLLRCGGLTLVWHCYFSAQVFDLFLMCEWHHGYDRLSHWVVL